MSIRRRVAALGALLLAAGVIRRSRTLSAVAPDLRTPALWLPLRVDNRPLLAVARRLYSRATEPVAGVTVTARDVPGGLDVVVHEPGGRTRPSGALLWMHGGGTILGRPETDHQLCSRIAARVGIPVVSVRYRLAPEHPFPAGLDDCSAALRWVHESAGELGVDPARIAVGGASAGGLLAAAVVQRAHDDGLPVAFQALVYPMLDDRTVLRADHPGRGRILWTPRSNAYAWGAYLGFVPGTVEPPPYAVPARREDLDGLPPAWIGVGDLDLFHDEDLAYAHRLEKAGVPVTVRVQQGMYHAAEVELHATVASMRAFQEDMFEALATALRG